MPELKGTHGFSDHQTFKEVVNGLFWVVVSVTLILDTQALCRYQMRDKQAQKTYKENKSYQRNKNYTKKKILCLPSKNHQDENCVHLVGGNGHP